MKFSSNDSVVKKFISAKKVFGIHFGKLLRDYSFEFKVTGFLIGCFPITKIIARFVKLCIFVKKHQ